MSVKEAPHGLNKIQHKSMDRMSFDLLDAVQSPVIVAHNDCPDMGIENLICMIRVARLVMHISIAKGAVAEATIPEVCIYLMTASVKTPPSREWANVYAHALKEYLVKWKALTSKEFPDFLSSVQLSVHEQSLFRSLSQWLYDRRRPC